MTSKEVAEQLERIAQDADFASRSADLTQAWESAGAGAEILEPVLRFMERHPLIDYGIPGALVHFLERFNAAGYEERLVESVKRRPIGVTVWMLNRLINGTKELHVRDRLRSVVKEVIKNSLADDDTRTKAAHFLARPSSNAERLQG